MKTGFLLFCGLFVGFVFVAGCTPQQTIASDPKLSTITSTEEGVAPAVPQIPEKPEKPVRPKTPPKEATAAGPTITFEEPVHDFGSVGPSSSHQADFVFSNSGSEILKIERFHAPCGCTVPELAKREYAPGESGTVRVRYSAPAGAATDVKPIYVYTNDPKTPQYELTVKAKVAVNVEITPGEVDLMLNQGNAGMPSLSIRSTDGQQFAVTSGTSTNNVMTIPFDSKKRGTEFAIEPKVDLKKLETTPNGLIQIRTDHPNSGMLTVRFNAKPLFEVSHPRIILQNIVPGEDIVREVWIRSNYDRKVEIESFSSTNGMMTIVSQQEDGNHLKIVVKITPTTNAPAAGRRYITDELNIQLTNGQEVSIRCSGWFRLN